MEQWEVKRRAEPEDVFELSPLRLLGSGGVMIRSGCCHPLADADRPLRSLLCFGEIERGSSADTGRALNSDAGCTCKRREHFLGWVATQIQGSTTAASGRGGAAERWWRRNPPLLCRCASYDQRRLRPVYIRSDACLARDQ